MNQTPRVGRVRRFTPMLVAVSAALLFVAGAAGAPPRPGGRVAVFVSPSGVMLVDVARPGEQRLALGSAVVAVSPSPDASLLAYTTISGLTMSLVVADRRTLRQRWRLGNVVVFDAPVWAPHGQRFVFTTLSQLWVGGARRSDLRRLATDYNNQGFAWSPDGHTLAYSSKRGLVRVDLADRRHRRLVATAPAIKPAWSPTGRWLAYLSRGRLEVVDPSGHARPIEIAHTPTEQITNVEWSPDGGTLAYVIDGALVVNEVDHHDRNRRLSGGAVLDASWSPDSTRLAYSIGRPNQATTALFVVGRSGGPAHRLTAPAGADGDRGPIWSPDGRRLLFRRSARGLVRVYVVDSNGAAALPVIGDDLGSVTDGDVCLTSCSLGAAWLPADISLPPPPPLVPVHPRAEMTSGSSFGALAVDGSSVAALVSYSAGGFWNGWDSILWSPIDGRTGSAHVRCEGGTVTSDFVEGPVLAGDRYAYVCSPDQEDDTLFVATREQPQADSPVLEAAHVSVAGAGSLLVAGVDGDLLRLESNGSRTLLLHYPQSITVLGADQDHVLVQPDRHSLQVVGADGMALSGMLSVPHEDGAVLRGSHLFVLDAGTMTVLDLAGHPQQEQELPAADARLEDVAADLVLYDANARLHLYRLTDGRDIPLTLPGQLTPASARFTSDGGIVAGYDTAGDRPGTIVYISADVVAGLLATRP